MSKLINIEPQSLWSHFEAINAIPRASKKEDKIIEFMLSFGQNLGLETIKDNVGNIIIKKPATLGMDDRKTIVLQSHLDMVHQKNNTTDFDFATQGIDMYIEGDWVKARGTTLGADNGIGVAMIMSILASKDIAHPNIEALFTIDEETGMTGALGLEEGLLSGSIMLNMDTEEDTELDIGCAGGIDVTATFAYDEELVDSHLFTLYEFSLSGLLGGHSGMEIHLGRGNANKLMARLMYDLYEKTGARLASFDGGGLRNAIPREAVVSLYLPNDRIEETLLIINHRFDEIYEEYKRIEPSLTLDVTLKEDQDIRCCSIKDQSSMIKTIYASFNGIYRMSPDISDLVETSNNVARVKISNGKAQILCLTRSSVESSKNDLVQHLTSIFSLGGFSVSTSGNYPGWQPNPNSEILLLMKELYKSIFDEEPNIVSCHAGLECGIIGSKYPSMEMISYGPNIKHAHSPDEKVQISSVQKFWKYTLDILKNIPKYNS